MPAHRRIGEVAPFECRVAQATLEQDLVADNIGTVHVHRVDESGGAIQHLGTAVLGAEAGGKEAVLFVAETKISHASGGALHEPLLPWVPLEGLLDNRGDL